MKQNLLLIADVDELGRSGEIVSVKPGYARNFLLPKKLAYVATPHTLLMQKKLQEERAKKAVIDKKEAEELAKIIEKFNIETHVKVDPEGKMYGSVTAHDIAVLLEGKEIKIDKRQVLLKSPLKETGTYDITLKLKEGVLATFKLVIIGEGARLAPKKAHAPKETKEVNEAEEMKEAAVVEEPKKSKKTSAPKEAKETTEAEETEEVKPVKPKKARASKEKDKGVKEKE